MSNKPLRIIIAGSRDFDDYELLKRLCNTIIGNNEYVEIVSGGARGADKLGEKYASEKGYKIVKFPADWDKHGKSAGYIRNRLMGEYSDMLIAFWDGKSKGTLNMISIAKELNLDWSLWHY